MSIRTTRDHRKIPGLSWVIHREYHEASDYWVQFFLGEEDIGHDFAPLNDLYDAVWEKKRLLFHYRAHLSSGAEVIRQHEVALRETETQIVGVPISLYDEQVSSLPILTKKDFCQLCHLILESRGERPSNRKIPEYPTMNVKELEDFWLMTCPPTHFRSDTNRYTFAETLQKQALEDCTDERLMRMIVGLGKEPLCSRFRIVSASPLWKTVSFYMESADGVFVEWKALFDTTPLCLRLSDYWAVEILE